MAAAQHCATAAALALLDRERQMLANADDHALFRPARHKSEYPLLEQVRLSAGLGRQNLERFERALTFLFTQCGVRLGHLQHMFLAAARTVLLQRMYGASIVAEADELRRRFALKRLYSVASIIFPRRSGKTTVQTILGAVVAASQPDGNLVVFNLTNRQSKAWLHQCIKWLEMFKASPEFNYVEVQRDMRETIVIRNCCGTTARIASFAGGTTTTGGAAGTNLRGMGERIMLMMLDEFMFMQPSLYQTILPLLTNGAAMLLTSSMSASADDEIRRMLHAKMPDGREVVLRLDWIRSCAECKARGTPDRCTHLRQRPQHFQRSVDQERLQALMRPFGEDGINRELFNIGGRATISPVFERAWLDPLKNRACDFHNTTNKDYRYFFVAVDPAGEGFSQNVIVSAMLEESLLPGSPAPFTFVVHFFTVFRYYFYFTISISISGFWDPRGCKPCWPMSHQCAINWTKSRVMVCMRCSMAALCAMSASSASINGDR